MGHFRCEFIFHQSHPSLLQYIFTSFFIFIHNSAEQKMCTVSVAAIKRATPKPIGEGDTEGAVRGSGFKRDNTFAASIIKDDTGASATDAI
ncbi:hypothetical protein SPOG_04994 [Schizosaccharomyces cryophilus OY26]|uniref:Uncharacterized protein n=1 Tax=Schizosaccharomyces cryophilus (strain OY26 / ATCC MYA-4695 / CBS 11777 / NBRC 106824 / NRRL Y48691) TaxID=653667 RepID=S9WWM1_SCHCR|nr:uncharacterized protein SPOG_04994 [Schizosaccharomyces cryophilus OY26]EPY49152.1 hypothetical protein SPOG_04994 [Schizosaccharomyces cryophilus OY26]